MKLSARMSVGEAAREVLGVLREYAPSLLAGALVAGAALGLFAALRSHEDTLITRMLDVEASGLSNATARALENRALEMLELARRFEGDAAVDSASWAREAVAMIERDSVLRAVEWRNSSLQPEWSVPIVARLGGGDLDTIFEVERIGAVGSASTRASGSVAPTFTGAHGQRLLLFAAPMLQSGSRVGVLDGIVHVRDLLDAVLSPEQRHGFAIAVREGPYRVYGPDAPPRGSEAARWWRSQPMQVGELEWSIEYWPGPELLDRVRSFGPPLSLMAGLFAAMMIASLVRTAQLARRAEEQNREGRASLQS